MKFVSNIRKFVEEYSEEFFKGESVALLSPTNKGVHNLNLKIRDQLGFVEPLCVGDHLLINRTLLSHNVTNGDVYKVVEVLEDENIKCFLRGDETETKVFLKNVVLQDPNTKSTFVGKVCINYLLNDRPCLTKKEKQALIVDYKKRCNRFKADIDPHYKDPRLNPILARYSYALTFHKAQCLEVDKVYVHLNNYESLVSNPISLNRYQRWLYTAFSRATKELVIVSSRWV